MTRRSLFTIGIVAALIVGGVGVWYWRTEPTQKIYSGPTEKITIAQGVTPNSALVHIAFVEGYFRDQGLDVEMQLHTSGKEPARL